MRCIRIDLMCRQRPSMHAICSRRASLCLVAAAFIRLPTASVPLNTRAPLVRDLTSVPAARPTMGWHGQAKQPMLQSALSVLAVVTDAQGALPWTEAATRVWVAAVWPRSMWSGSSAQLASKLVWRPPRHGGVVELSAIPISRNLQLRLSHTLDTDQRSRTLFLTGTLSGLLSHSAGTHLNVGRFPSPTRSAHTFGFSHQTSWRERLRGRDAHGQLGGEPRSL